MREFSVRIAGFSYRVVARCHSLEFALNVSQAKFAQEPTQPCQLALDVVTDTRFPLSQDEVVFESPTGYAVGRTAQGHLMIRGRSAPALPVLMEVDDGFQAGKVYISPDGIEEGSAVYPLETIDLVMAIHRFARTGGVIVHGAGIAYGGRGFLFAGPSGAGKSTMADLWSEDPQSVILGEDTAIVAWSEGRAWIWGTPWHENPARCAAAGVPLDAVFLAGHGGVNRASRCGRADGMARLLGDSLLPLYDRGAMQAILEGVDRLSESVPVYRLDFRPDRDVVEYVLRVTEK